MIGVVAGLAAVVSVGCWPPPDSRRLRSLEVTSLNVSGRHLLIGWALVQVGALLAGVPLLTAGAGAVTAAVGWGLRQRHRGQVRRLREEAVAEVVFALAAELRAGRTPAQAMAGAAAGAGVLHRELVVAARAVRAGVPAAEPLRTLATVAGCEAMGAVGAVWQVTEQAGGAVADVLERLGRTLDADAADRRSFEAILAGPRASMLLLAGLPALGLVMAQSAGARPVHLLLHRPLGWTLFAGAAVLEVVGLLWSRRLVRGALPR